MQRLFIILACVAFSACIAVGLGCFIQPTVSVDYKHIYSDIVKCEIDLFTKNYFASQTRGSFLSTDLQVFYDKLKDRFRVVKKVDWRWDSLGHASVLVEGVAPKVRVNNAFVMGNKKRLFPYSVFANTTVDELCSLHLPRHARAKDNAGVLTQKVPASVYSFVQNVPDGCWQSYTVSYSNQNCAFLHDRGGRDYRKRVIVSDAAIHDKEKMQVVDFIHDALVEDMNNGGGRWRKKRSVAYDIRFKNRVYARVLKKSVRG